MNPNDNTERIVAGMFVAGIATEMIIRKVHSHRRKKKQLDRLRRDAIALITTVLSDEKAVEQIRTDVEFRRIVNNM